VRPDSLAQVFINSNGLANCELKNNIKDAFMPEILWDVNESHRKTVGYPTKFYNYLKSHSYFASFQEIFYSN
jgi:hypothetical protein